jgi:stage IV sporulation protein FB
MKNAFKLFDFMGTPVYLKYWFFIFLLAGPATFIAIFISVLVHELAHAHVATKRGYKVDHVFIDFLVGGASIEMDRLSYKDTILISVVGPLSNLALSLLGYAYGLYVGSSNFIILFTTMNLYFFIFNMLPIFPMDGGRISKAIIQSLTKPTIGRKINGVLSIVTSIGLMVFSFMNAFYILAIFSFLFIYVGYTEIKQKY